VRVVGAKDMPVTTICLGLGAVGFNQINMLIESDCEVFITGEVGEVCTLEYVRDACYFGEKKAVILFGHFSAEYAGMRLLAEHLNDVLLPTIYLHGGEVYSKIV
jgi:putative NIF3 family GTP cyclohydrolase 1 type 2